MTISAAERPSYGEVRESVAVARSHGEKFFEQIVWQVEHQAWTILGYGSWDEMREAEYADMGVVAPRADRPELVSRLRSKGLTQKQIGDTLGVHRETVAKDIAASMSDSDIEPEPITNSRGQQRPATYQRREPVNTETGEVSDDYPTEVLPAGSGEAAASPTEGRGGTPPAPRPSVTEPARPEPRKPQRRSLVDDARDAGQELRKATERLQRIASDDRLGRNKNEVAAHLRHHLEQALTVCQDLSNLIN